MKSSGNSTHSCHERKWVGAKCLTPRSSGPDPALHTGRSAELEDVKQGVDNRHTLYDISYVKYFSWSPEKNRLLQTSRGISFEEVVFHVEKGDVLEILEHPNQEKYSGQRITVVNIEGYVYLVPFVEDDREVFLKTIIPSRKATRDYLGGP